MTRWANVPRPSSCAGCSATARPSTRVGRTWRRSRSASSVDSAWTSVLKVDTVCDVRFKPGSRLVMPRSASSSGSSLVKMQIRSTVGTTFQNFHIDLPGPVSMGCREPHCLGHAVRWPLVGSGNRYPRHRASSATPSLFTGRKNAHNSDTMGARASPRMGPPVVPATPESDAGVFGQSRRGVLQPQGPLW